MIVRVKVVFRKTVVGDLASNHLPNNNNNISLINLSSTTRAIFLRRTSNDGSEHDSNGESKCFSLRADPLWTKGNNNQLKMSDQQVSMGWSPKPIVGHCSDTLCNNSGHSAIELWIPFHWPHPWHYSPHPSTHTHTGHFIKLTWCLKCMENTAWTNVKVFSILAKNKFRANYKYKFSFNLWRAPRTNPLSWMFSHLVDVYFIYFWCQVRASWDVKLLIWQI